MMPKQKSAAAIDADTEQLMRDLEQGLQEASAGVYARVNTSAEIAKRSPGRPVQATHKQPVTLRLDPLTLSILRASGKGWQTRAANILDSWVRAHSTV